MIKIEPPAGDIGRVAAAPHRRHRAILCAAERRQKKPQPRSQLARGARDREVALRDGRYHRRELPARHAGSASASPTKMSAPTTRGSSTSRSAATGRRPPGATARPSRRPSKRNRPHRHPRNPFRRGADRGPQRRLQPRRCLYGAARGHRRPGRAAASRPTGEGQYVDVSMAATMLSVTSGRVRCCPRSIRTGNRHPFGHDSHIFQLPDGRRLTIAASPIYTPMFQSLLLDDAAERPAGRPALRHRQTAPTNLADLLAEVRAWILTFTDRRPAAGAGQRGRTGDR